MKTHQLLLLCLLLSINSFAGRNDSTKAAVPTITYNRLDSLIRTSNLTAVYLWPSWCAPCREKFPAIVDLMREKKNISFISINDPDSRSFLPKNLIDHPDVIKGYYRIQHQGPKEFITINDRSQFRYFYWHFTKRQIGTRPEPNQYFMLFDRKGRLLYHREEYVSADSLKGDLAKYNWLVATISCPYCRLLWKSQNWSNNLLISLIVSNFFSRGKFCLTISQTRFQWSLWTFQ